MNRRRPSSPGNGDEKNQRPREAAVPDALAAPAETSNHTPAPPARMRKECRERSSSPRTCSVAFAPLVERNKSASHAAKRDRKSLVT